MPCNPNCCCSACGKKLADPNSLCCSCVCDKLCVTISGGGVVECPPTTGTGSGETCGCTEVTVAVDWDDTQCAWVGIVACGSLSIDLKFEVLNLEGDCYFCLTSDCLGLIQLGTGTGTGDECQLITPGCGQDKFCGEFTKDGDQRTGWDPDVLLGNWTADASDCGDLVCTSVEIRAICADRTNPAGRGTTRVCTDCDCVCNCVCLTYEEDACDPQTVKVCWRGETGTGSDGPWEHTFTGCPDGDQTVTITIERGDDGCCEWHLETTRGTVTTPNVKTDCPRADHTWGITGLAAAGTATVEIACAECTECLVQTTCCDDPLPRTLTGTIQPTDLCPTASGTVTLVVTSIDNSDPASPIVIYEGTATICGDSFDYTLICNSGAWTLQTVLTTANGCVDSGGALADSNACCNPVYLEFTNVGGECAPCCDPAGIFGIIITE
ncbi:hypothetical protein LCGC14_0727940 [marine sediment metagenome]|uniref:Uncharacterized protein n=1 Tax=marine sediment metagenome TaxID=412755 RepID=A0A0F9QVF2_9ZZZZ